MVGVNGTEIVGLTALYEAGRINRNEFEVAVLEAVLCGLVSEDFAPGWTWQTVFKNNRKIAAQLKFVFTENEFRVQVEKSREEEP